LVVVARVTTVKVVGSIASIIIDGGVSGRVAGILDFCGA
jgi:hypothetical protein